MMLDFRKRVLVPTFVICTVNKIFDTSLNHFIYSFCFIYSKLCSKRIPLNRLFFTALIAVFFSGPPRPFSFICWSQTSASGVQRIEHLPHTQESCVTFVHSSCFVFLQEGRTVLTVMMGGAWYSDLFGSSPSPEHLGNIAVEQVKRALGIKMAPVHRHVSVLENCIPQYLVGK